VTSEEAFWLSQGRPILLVPRQVEALKAQLVPRTIGGQDASRLVLATHDEKAAALCDLRAGRLNPTRVFHLISES
jgi:tRNA pseudouridine55 synthase